MFAPEFYVRRPIGNFMHRNCGTPFSHCNDDVMFFPKKIAEMLRQIEKPMLCACEKSLPYTMYADEKEYTVFAETPGAKREDIHMTIEDDVLTVSYTKNAPECTEENNRKMCACHIRYGQFERKISIPEDVQKDRISASYADGVLTVKLPIAEESKPVKRTIEIAQA